MIERQAASWAQLPSTLPELSARAADLWPDRNGLIFDYDRAALTFQEIETLSDQVATLLRGLGTGPGDRVGVMMRNRWEYPISWLGILKAGAAAVSINVNYRRHDAKGVIDHSQITSVIADPEYTGLLEELAGEHTALRHIIGSGYVDGVTSSLLEAWNSSPPTRGSFRLSSFPEDLANVQYTSGTTGGPKGCLLTHAYWLRIAHTLARWGTQLSHDDILLTAQPFHYMDPLWNFTTSLWIGGPLVVLDRFHPSSFWERVRMHKVTFFYCLGVMPTLLAKTPEADTDGEHHLRQVYCSGIPRDLHAYLQRRFGVQWCELFGSTETGGDIAMDPHELEQRPDLVGSGAIGRPLPHREVRILDEHDRPVARGASGELAVRGTGMMEGYLEDVAATHSSFRGGWYHTGDAAWMNDEGIIYYLHRAKDTIRRSDENIAPSELEDVLNSHPLVRMSACVGIPDEIRGEEVKAYIVLNETASQDPDLHQEILQFTREQLAYFKVPRYWTYRDSLPLTASEKIAKHRLWEQQDPRGATFDATDGTWR